jgi:orotate phosphoribosyltransferase
VSEVLDLFRECGALLEGHFQLSSGLHSPRYLQCARVLMHPWHAERLCRDLRERWEGGRPDLVIGPALGGVTFAYELARAFGVPGIFAEREEGRFRLRRGFAVPRDARVLVGEDVVTTGGSAAEVAGLVQSEGGRVIGVMAIIRRTHGNPFSVPFLALEEIIPPLWSPEECPLCLSGSPATKPGSRPGRVAP